MKLLVWEGDGFSMYYKRLEKGTYELPAMVNNDSSAVSASEKDISMRVKSVDNDWPVMLAITAFCNFGFG